MTPRRSKHRTVRAADELDAANDNGEGYDAAAAGREFLEQLRAGDIPEAANDAPERPRGPVGVLLASFPRKPGEELRVTREVYMADGGERRPYVAIRLWRLTGPGDWRPCSRGATVRMSELRTVASALGFARAAGDDSTSASE